LEIVKVKSLSIVLIISKNKENEGKRKKERRGKERKGKERKGKEKEKEKEKKRKEKKRKEKKRKEKRKEKKRKETKRNETKKQIREPEGWEVCGGHQLTWIYPSCWDPGSRARKPHHSNSCLPGRGITRTLPQAINSLN